MLKLYNSKYEISFISILARLFILVPLNKIIKLKLKINCIYILFMIYKFKCDSINTKSLTGWSWTIIKYMTQVCAALK